MESDKRKKGCPNESCERHQKKIKLKASEEFCPKCGSKLIYVCSKCFRQIEDLDPSHKTCKYCDASGQQRKDAAVDKAKKVGKAGIGLVTPVVIGIAGKVIQDAQKGVVKKGVEFIESTAKNVIKR